MGEVSAIYGSIKLNTAELDSGLRSLRSSMKEADGLLAGLGRTGEGVSKGSASWFSSFTSTMVGFVAANVLGSIASGLQGIASAALTSTGAMQTMQLTIESLLAREIAKGKATIETHQGIIGITAEEKAKLGDLRLEYDSLSARVNEETERLRQLTAQWGASGLTVKTHTADLEKLKGKLAETGGEINALASKESQLTTIEETVYVGGMKISEALVAARAPAKTLMDELANLAILSPYTSTVVMDTWRMAKMFGFTAEESKVFTKSLLDVAAGSGLTGEMLGRASYNLAQVRMQGKVTAMDIRQLANAGFDLTGILQYMGERMGIQIKDHEDFNKALDTGKIKWSDFTKYFEEYAQTQFGGAADRMARTLDGLKSTISDVFTLTLPKVLGPAVEEVTSTLSGLLGILLEVRKSGVLEELGAKLGVKLKEALGPINDLISRTQTYFGILDARKKAAAGAKELGMPLGKAVALEEIAVPEVPGGGLIEYIFGKDGVTFLDNINKSLQPVKDAFAWIQAKLAAPAAAPKKGERGRGKMGLPLEDLEAAQAMPKGLIASIFGEGGADFINTLGEALKRVQDAFTWLNTNQELVKGALAGIAVGLLAAAVATTILNIALAPELLIFDALILGCGLLGAAWSKDWGGIRTDLTQAWKEMGPIFDKLGEAFGRLKLWLGGIVKLWTDFLGPIWGAITGAFTGPAPGPAPGTALGTAPGPGEPGGPLGPASPATLKPQPQPPTYGEFLPGGLQAGGIVTRPTLAMVGEAGPEAILPLRGGSAGLGRNTTIVVQSVLPPNEFQLLQLARMLRPALEAA